MFPDVLGRSLLIGGDTHSEEFTQFKVSSPPLPSLSPGPFPETIRYPASNAPPATPWAGSLQTPHPPALWLLLAPAAAWRCLCHSASSWRLLTVLTLSMLERRNGEDARPCGAQPLSLSLFLTSLHPTHVLWVPPRGAQHPLPCIPLPSPPLLNLGCTEVGGSWGDL